MRTIVLSDAHGHPELITAVLADCRFCQGADRLIFAGDFLDRGSRPEECLEILVGAGAEMLWGNHDAAILLGDVIAPQDWRSWAFRARLLEAFTSGAWRLVASADGVLISHAGISAQIAAAAGSVDTDALADALNAEFRLAVEDYLTGATRELHPLLGNTGPLWLRPSYAGPRQPLFSVPQIAGHTAPDCGCSEDLRRRGFHLIDPGASGLPEGIAPWQFRYALLDGSAVEVREGLLSADIVLRKVHLCSSREAGS